MKSKNYTNKPDFFKEWHPTKNGDLKPDDVTKGSNKKVWWKCWGFRHDLSMRILSDYAKRAFILLRPCILPSMRNFKRDSIFSPCALIINQKNVNAFMVNFSRMGAMITTQYVLSRKKYVSLLYRNEKNEIVRMLAYVVHSYKKDHYYVSGLQFVGIESKFN